MVTGIRALVVSREERGLECGINGELCGRVKCSVPFWVWRLNKCVCWSKLIKMYIKSAFYCM